LKKRRSDYFLLRLLNWQSAIDNWKYLFVLVYVHVFRIDDVVVSRTAA
jgi:hypothetical protein